MYKTKSGKTFRRPQEREALLAKIKVLVDKGMTIQDASAQHGVHKTFWYSKRKIDKALANQSGRKQATGPRLISLPIPEDDNIMLIVGKASAVNQALQSLAAIQRS